MSWCEWPEFYQDDERTARKEYTCCECDAPILKGEKYLYCRGKWDGRFGIYRQHLLCRDACVFIRDAFQPGECIGFGELMSEWKEYRGYDKYSDRPRKTFDQDFKDFRKLMAAILWRARCHRVFYRRNPEGAYVARAWGSAGWIPRTVSVPMKEFQP